MTKNTESAKPGKPYPDFPLYAHATGRWAKKIKGKTCFFGPWNDWQGALANYEAQRDGRRPVVDTGLLTVRQLCNEFLTAKKARIESGELTKRSFADYHFTCSLMVEWFKDRTVEGLVPADFEEYRASLSKSRKLVALQNQVLRTRVVLNYAYKAGLIDRPVRFGLGLAKPARSSILKERAAKGRKDFTREELHAILKAANKPMRAFVLLALNGGLGNNDLGLLERRHIVGDWLSMPRSKTGKERRFRLWPETIEAINDVRRPAGGDLPYLFLTKRGQCWSKSTSENPISAEFRKLTEKLGFYRSGRGFYGLRHSFATIASQTRDQVAVDFIMGHADASSDMAAVYREHLDDERLQAVTDHVRGWLSPIPKRGDA